MAETQATPKLVTLTINDRKLEVPAGTLLIEACRQAHIEIPSFCYYPNLSLQAACRMCLVEIEKMPKLQTACTVQVTEGMVVRSETETVKAARKSAIEFILTNHPLDCPVCDAGGECELQDMTFSYGAAEGRFVEPKRHRDEQQWSPIVYFDRPRCILCYRCVRVCGEGMDVWALGVANRAIQATIIPNHQDHLECEECGMCIDICPVGALTSGAYRYKTRPWEMKHVGSICTFCGDGCKTTLGVRNDQILRGDNRDKSGINGEFLCIKGRYGFDFTQHPERLKQPLARRDGELRPVSWTYALDLVGQRLKAAGGAVGVVGSTRLLNEECYALGKLARRVLGTNHIDHHRSADYRVFFDALGGAGTPAPLASSADLKTAPAVLLVGGDPTEEHPLIAWNLRWGYRLHNTRLYVVDDRDIKLRRQAFRFAQVATGELGAAVRALAGGGEMKVSLTGVGAANEKRWPQTPVSEPVAMSGGLAELQQRLAEEKDLIIIAGADVRGAELRTLIEFGRARAGRTRFIALGDHSNSRGASDMGLYPDLLPGYAGLGDAAARSRWEEVWGGALPTHTGATLPEMMSGRAQLAALYIAGANPYRRFPGAAEALRGAFVVVQDLFLTETARHADVVLPALCSYEKNGTLTNTCGEVQAQQRGGWFEGAKSDLEIFYLVAEALGADWGTPDPDRLLQEIRANVHGYEVSLVQLMSGRSALATPVNGRIAATLTDDLGAPEHNSLFTAGTLGRYSSTLNAVLERRLPRADSEGQR